MSEAFLTTEPITGTEPYLDSREIEERLTDLEGYLLTLREEGAGPDEDAEAEFAELNTLREDADPTGEWPYGMQFIREDRFEEHAQDLADDLGLIQKDAAWPMSYIDWSAAADALRMDYSVFTLFGTTYFARA